MANYRRSYVPGGTFFFTLVTYQRTHLFADPENVLRLRRAVATVKKDLPFDFEAAVVLPDHMHFLWTLPAGDANYSKRLGRIKMEFTSSLRAAKALPAARLSASRRKHRESAVWQRRFLEHTIRDEEDFAYHVDYIHYNPVKHGLTTCPHFWPYSSFRKWFALGAYSMDWACVCHDSPGPEPVGNKVVDWAGEPQEAGGVAMAATVAAVGWAPPTGLLRLRWLP